MQIKIKEPTIHIQPISGQKVYGIRIFPGEVLSSEDVYNSSNGNWEPCPCPGNILGEGTITI